MNFQSIQNYLFPLLLIAFFGFKFYKSKTMKKKIPALLAEGAIIVDVRSPAEFKFGANPISINMPLDTVGAKCESLDKNKTIILCCASGARSAMAQGVFKKHGFGKVINAGAWTNTVA